MALDRRIAAGTPTTLRRGAGRSQVQLLSPRSQKSPAKCRILPLGGNTGTETKRGPISMGLGVGQAQKLALARGPQDPTPGSAALGSALRPVRNRVVARKAALAAHPTITRRVRRLNGWTLAKLAASGVPLRVLQEFLLRVDVKTTQIYAHCATQPVPDLWIQVQPSCRRRVRRRRATASRPEARRRLRG